MWLKFGLGEDNILVSIDESPRGQSGLRCPYCGGALIAKKGQVKVHHFAHAGETCQSVLRRRVPTLPLYDNFFVRLSALELYQLEQFWQQYGSQGQSIPHVPFRFVLSRLLCCNGEGYEFTPLGRIPIGILPLNEFNKVQEPLLLAELKNLTGRVERSMLLRSANLRERLADLDLYCAQLRRILQLKLYFLEVRTHKETFYKIGVTRRSMPERLLEIERDLKVLRSPVSINVLGTWECRGNVELYFKHCYRAFNYRIGRLTEYFKFDEPEAVFQNLCQMAPKVLSHEEVDVLQGSCVYCLFPSFNNAIPEQSRRAPLRGAGQSQRFES